MPIELETYDADKVANVCRWVVEELRSRPIARDVLSLEVLYNAEDVLKTLRKERGA